VPVLANELDVPYAWPMRAREGLSGGDLAPYGGALILDAPGLIVPVLPGLPSELGYGLMDIVGATRAWPLAEPAGDGEASACEIVAFAAGRICRVSRGSGETNDIWEIVVQPTTMVSSQAVTAAAAPRNPWIGKLELTQ
jgi:hypothetical protein